MTCPHCESTTAFRGKIVHIWPPQGHSLAKLEKALKLAGYAGVERDDLMLTVHDVEHSDLAKQFEEVFTEPERRDSRLLVTEGERVTVSHIPRVLNVETYIVSVHGAWLEDVLREERLHFHFQPIVDREQRIYGHEALVRASYRDGTPISPAQLFSAAATPALLASLDRQARLGAVSHMPSMPSGTRMFINFMPSTIYDPYYCLQSTAKAVEAIGVDPRNVVFEVVESDKVQDGEHLRNIVQFYMDNGYSVGLDDFGTGNNNLVTLLEMNPNFIKIDKAITNRLVDDNASRGLVRDLVRQAGSRGTQVIAEGVETESEHALCLDLGVDFFQGFYFARPRSSFHSDAEIRGLQA